MAKRRETPTARRYGPEMTSADDMYVPGSEPERDGKIKRSSVSSSLSFRDPNNIEKRNNYVFQSDFLGRSRLWKSFRRPNDHEFTCLPYRSDSALRVERRLYKTARRVPPIRRFVRESDGRTRVRRRHDTRLIASKTGRGSFAAAAAIRT